MNKKKKIKHKVKLIVRLFKEWCRTSRASVVGPDSATKKRSVLSLPHLNCPPAVAISSLLSTLSRHLSALFPRFPRRCWGYETYFGIGLRRPAHCQQLSSHTAARAAPLLLLCHIWEASSWLTGEWVGFGVGILLFYRAKLWSCL